jgi:hypothetical protein
MGAKTTNSKTAADESHWREVFTELQQDGVELGVISLMRANRADLNEASGDLPGVGLGERGRPVAERCFCETSFPQEGTPVNYSICLAALLTSQVQRLLVEAHETLLPYLRQIAELVASFFAGGNHSRGSAEV